MVDGRINLRQVLEDAQPLLAALVESGVEVKVNVTISEACGAQVDIQPPVRNREAALIEAAPDTTEWFDAMSGRAPDEHNNETTEGQEECDPGLEPRTSGGLATA